MRLKSMKRKHGTNTYMYNRLWTL